MANYFIYRNLRTKGFSVRYRGKVIDRVQEAVLFGVKFVVNEKGRQRVISENVKNVHAFAVARDVLKADIDISGQPLTEVKYNPYKNNCFMLDGEPIYTSNFVVLSGGKCLTRSCKINSISDGE